MKKVISIISPQFGTAGTDINLLKIAEGLINEEFDVRLLIVGDEWSGKKIKPEIKVVYLIPRYIFKFIKNKYIEEAHSAFITSTDLNLISKFLPEQLMQYLYNDLKKFD